MQSVAMPDTPLRSPETPCEDSSFSSAFDKLISADASALALLSSAEEIKPMTAEFPPICNYFNPDVIRTVQPSPAPDITTLRREYYQEPASFPLPSQSSLFPFEGLDNSLQQSSEDKGILHIFIYFLFLSLA